MEPKQLKGKIFWVQNNPEYTLSKPKKYILTMSVLEKIHFGNEFDFIQFSIPKGNIIEKRYTIVLENCGTYFKQHTEDYTIECEFLEDQGTNTFILYGRWSEDVIYTWSAIIEEF